MENRLHISVIVPVYNEERNLSQLLSELEKALENHSYEAIFVDDGSTDNSFDVLKGAREKNGNIKIIQFNGNFGQHAALTAAYQVAKGEIILTMDADLQSDPADIPKFIEKIEQEGNMAAFGWRINRENGYISRQLPSKLFNSLRNYFLHRKLHDYGCPMNAFRRQFVDELRETPDFLKHITTYIASKRVPYVEVRISERARFSGKSRYNFIRLLQLALDLLITTAAKPLATSFLLFTAAASFAFFLVSAGVVTVRILFGNECTLACFILPYIFFTSSVICGGLALINEKISMINRHMQKKPLYIIKEYLD